MKTSIKSAMKALVIVGALLGSTAVYASGADLYKKCASCHGQQGEKKALGKSKVITGWDVTKTKTALNGYKDGTYGGAMKGLMKSQVASLNDAQIEEISKYISTLK